MRKLALTLAVALSTSTASAQATDAQIVGAIVGGVVLNELFRGAIPPSPRLDGPYGYGGGRGRSDPSRVCGVTPVYNGPWVDIVETNCWGTVLRVTRRARY